ncbi:MAG: hypothetical protein ACRC3Y_04775 [Romboutsia sp.]|uniref:hypothetical protein n=1 Tax=Romboutsia sp. TaxID=1965302 RepID=UPI003F2F0312
MKIDKIKITFKNDFVRIVERNNVKNFNSLVDWIEMFNNSENVSLLTLSGKELGSSFSINKNNIKSIEII